MDNTPGDKLGVWRDMRLADALVLMKFGTQGEVADVIMCTEFFLNSIFTQFVEELRSSSTPKLSFPEHSVFRPYNSVLFIINYNNCQQCCGLSL